MRLCENIENERKAELMNVELKPSCKEEIEKLDILYEAACKFFKSIDPDPHGTPPEKCITRGCLTPNGVFVNYRILSIYVENEFIGYCDFYMGYPDDKTVYISFIYVSESYRKKGYAGQVVNTLIRQFSEENYEKVRLTVSL